MKRIARILFVTIACVTFWAPTAMAARKLLVNHTPYALDIVLVIRASSDIRRVAGTKDVHLLPHQALYEEYGDNTNIYLNGIRIFATHDGERIGNELIVVQRGSSVDNTLNNYQRLDIEQYFHGLSFIVMGRPNQ